MRSLGKSAVCFGYDSATWAIKSMSSCSDTRLLDVSGATGFARKRARRDWYCRYWFSKSEM